MRRTVAITGGILAVAMSVSMAAQRSTHEFEGHKFSLQLPAGYVVGADANPRPGFKTFGFTTEPRSDGTRGMIQISLLDFNTAPASEKVSLERFATAMIKGVSQRRTRWEQKESAIQIAGVPATRFEWTGSTEPGFGRPPVHMRGVMIVGIKRTVGFTLQTQDGVAFADTTLPLCEQALQTFELTARR